MDLTLCLPLESTDISRLTKYMMTATRWKELDKYSCFHEPLLKDENVVIETQEESVHEKCLKYTLYTKGAMDDLFWSLFISHYGMNEYYRVGVNNGNEEMKERKKIVEYLHSQSTAYLSTLCNYKITKVFIATIIEELLTSPKITLACLVGFSLYYKSSIYIIDYERKLYLHFSILNPENNYILYKNAAYNRKDKKSNEYFIDIGTKIFSTQDIETQFVKVQYDKPMKGISAYTISALDKIAEKLSLDIEDENGKQLKKTELYSLIIHKCVW
jgi:hypothetical protein